MGIQRAMFVQLPLLFFFPYIQTIVAVVMALIFGLMSSFITARSVLKNTIGDSIRRAV